MISGTRIPDSVSLSLRRLNEEPGSLAAVAPSRDYIYREGKGIKKT